MLFLGALIPGSLNFGVVPGGINSVPSRSTTGPAGGIHGVINEAKEGKLARRKVASLLLHLRANSFRHAWNPVQPKVNVVEDEV